MLAGAVCFLVKLNVLEKAAHTGTNVRFFDTAATGRDSLSRVAGFTQSPLVLKTVTRRHTAPRFFVSVCLRSPFFLLYSLPVLGGKREGGEPESPVRSDSGLLCWQTI